MVFNKFVLSVDLFPPVVKSSTLLLVDVIVVVGLFHLSITFFSYNLPAHVIQHSLLSNPVDSSCILIALLLLRNLNFSNVCTVWPFMCWPRLF